MSYHPDLQLIEAYAEGSIDATHGLAVATHLEMCPHCRHQARQLEEQHGEALLSTEAILSDESNWQHMLSQITASDVHPAAKPLRSKPVVVSVNGRRIPVPHSLKRLVSPHAKWRSYGGKVFSLPLHHDDDVHMNLMYISAGVSIPQHTHRGLESTLVLHGAFSDEDGHYDAGDFLQRDASIRHSPQTALQQDCLCLTVLTQPMVFTQGVARIFNLFGKGLYP
ncbi:transcriptional regulator [Vibrio furnissii]|uniref:Transcriptional regulator n=1 Tax=Vibrio furnissii TaxID=29494 RepID=A0A0Q2RQI4_VIBFU|nr:ChrR family anti-sigma-E factor [Vibrio furnissii]KQH86302.1 transcriptional regulator [Vibrio furnissii]